MKRANFLFAIYIVFVILIFKSWFNLNLLLSTGDWPYLYPKSILQTVPFSTWDIMFNNGFGQSALSKIWFDSYALILLKLANILTWPIFERVVWFIPCVVISYLSSFYLSKKINLAPKYAVLSGAIYSLNTYILMIISGGQAGVFMAYAFLPAVFIALFNLQEKSSIKRSIILGLAISLLIMLDLRVGYMYLLAQVLISAIYLFLDSGKFIRVLLYTFILPGVITFLLHFYWILPIVLMGRSPVSDLTDIYTSSASLAFFSFAKLENSIALLHPNWPENIFGKVAFLRPEFLIVPILVFASLLFVSSEQKEKRTSILSLVMLAVLGIFLAKGTNEPFGQIYSFLFNTIPGFVMFRDPTKWYMLVAVSFSILIPYTLSKVSSIQYPVSRVFFSTLNSKLSIILSVAFLLFWGFLIRDALLGNVGGTLKPREISQDYVKLADMLAYDNNFYRTLWVPKYPTLAYVSNTHPAVPGTEFYLATSTANLINDLKSQRAEIDLQSSSVKYVIVPDDIYGKIFLADRKYDAKIYQKVLEEISQIKYLTRIPGFGKIGVFEVKKPQGHFFPQDIGTSIIYDYISPTHYLVHVNKTEKYEGNFVFTESYDKFWHAKVIGGEELIHDGVSFTGKNTFNSFRLLKMGKYDVDVKYKPQDWLNVGLIVSGISLIGIVIILLRVSAKGGLASGQKEL